MIIFRKMEEHEYNDWVKHSVLSYAEDMVSAGTWSQSEAQERSDKEFHSLLTNDLATLGHTILVAENGEATPVGIIWYLKKDATCAYIADFIVYNQFRRKGYGAAIILELESRVKSEGLSVIELHVFTHNKSAIALYKKCGYNVTKDTGSGGMFMEKQIIVL